MKTYGALTTLAGVYRLWAILVAWVGAIAGVWIGLSTRDGLTALGLIIGCFLLALLLAGFSELLELLIDLARDMHTTAAYFERRAGQGAQGVRQRPTEGRKAAPAQGQPRAVAHPLSRRMAGQ